MATRANDMIESLGSIGDFAGGIGVIATLIYQAIQIPQNTRQLDHDSEFVQVSAEIESACLLPSVRQVGWIPEWFDSRIAAQSDEIHIAASHLRNAHPGGAWKHTVVGHRAEGGW